MKKLYYKEEVDTLCLMLIQEITRRYPEFNFDSPGSKEDIFVEQLDNILNKLFEYPDYRNYN